MEAVAASIISKGTASGWTLCVLGLVGVILLAKIALMQRPQMKQMEISEGEALRTVFVSEMAALRSEVAKLREDNAGLRGEVRGLRDENKGLRDEVRQLHAVIDGMRREGLSGQISAQRVVADALPKSPEIERALMSLGNLQGDAKP